MDRLKRLLRRLEEQTGQHYEVVTLEGGEQLRYTSEDALEALGASIDVEPTGCCQPPGRRTTLPGLLGLVAALERSRLAQGDG